MDAFSDIMDKTMPDDNSKLANDKMMNIAKVKGVKHLHCRWCLHCSNLNYETWNILSIMVNSNGFLPYVVL
jgi:divalent metal cation (Fe/Co/Zn/Cd) transporter